LARQHATAAIASLAGIATNGKSESARVAACDVLLQRGWGKPQSSEIENRENIPPSENILSAASTSSSSGRAKKRF
jgi:hypothetical protein